MPANSEGDWSFPPAGIPWMRARYREVDQVFSLFQNSWMQMALRTKARRFLAME